MPVNEHETHVAIERELMRSWIRRLRQIRNTVNLYPVTPGSEPATQVLRDVSWLTASIDKAINYDVFDDLKARQRKGSKTP